MTAQDIIKSVIRRSEGGLVKNKYDKGGITKYGVSIRWYQLAINKKATEKHIEELTLDKAVEVYMIFFWMPMKIDSIKSKYVKEKYFDLGINMGISQATILMQRACNIISQKDDLQEDGVIGPKTISKINVYEEELLPVLRALQYMFYKSIIDKNPSQKVFWNGWRKRAYV